MKIGLFLSNDHGKVSDILDFTRIVKESSGYEKVAVFPSFFDAKAQKEILKLVEENQLEGIVFAGDSPRVFDEIISGQELIGKLDELGINPIHVSVANIKDQVAFPNENSREHATTKAILLIEVAKEKILKAHDVRFINVQPIKRVLIIGNSPGGIFSAYEFVKKGYRVTIIERSNTNLEKWKENQELQSYLANIQNNNDVKFMPNTDIDDFYGWAGLYKVTLNDGEKKTQIEVGGVVLANDDDSEWLAKLKLTMHLHVRGGHLWNRLSKNPDTIIGRTMDSGIWFIPYDKNPQTRYEHEISSASLAVTELDNILRKPEVKIAVLSSEVNADKCGGCCTCIKTCAFHATHFNLATKKAEVDIDRCKGCGNCVVACPTTARDLTTYPKEYMFSAIHTLNQANFDNLPKILTILCRGCGYIALDRAGSTGLKYPVNCMPLEIECGGNLDTQYILKALHEGFDGVALTICRDGECQHIFGNTDMVRRMGLLREILRTRGIGDDRVRVLKVDCTEGEQLVKELNEFNDDLKQSNRA